MTTKLTDEYMTPNTYLESVRKVLGIIDLDPASSFYANGRVKAVRYFSKEDNGLEQRWYGKLFINPPYSRPNLSLFVNKLLYCETDLVREAIILVPPSPWESWYIKLSANGIVCNTNHRIKFWHPTLKTSSPKGGGSFFYIGKNEEKFIEEFKKHGTVWRRI